MGSHDDAGDVPRVVKYFSTYEHSAQQGRHRLGAKDVVEHDLQRPGLEQIAGPSQDGEIQVSGIM